eukprot:GDKI01049748.1.p1 GENE.GDKI01049748.1~~GDKI01049748.1.p1  ORF type:complete len:116 (-),score=28.97 GDKI01049748.1:97-444(-)
MPPKAAKVSPETNELLLPANIGHNRKLMNHTRTLAAILGGIATGLLGFTGLSGLFMFVLVTLLSSFFIAVRADFNPTPYFPPPSGWKEVAYSNFTGGLMSFVLFWTLAYNFVYIF